MGHHTSLPPHSTNNRAEINERSAEIRRLLSNLHLQSMFFFSPKLATLLHPGSNVRVFFPGSLSHIVQHTAPGYRSLPKPGNLCQIHIHQTNEVKQPIVLKGKDKDSDQDSSANINDNTSLSSDCSFSEGSLQGPESGFDQEIDQSYVK